MIALMNRFSMNQEIRNRRRLPLDLCGPYVGDDLDSRVVRCYLQIARTSVAVDIPADLLHKHRLGGRGGVVLHLPGERMARVETAPLLTDSEQKLANGWSSEMEDFDRF